MNVLVDTNLTIRAAQPTHPKYQTAIDATDAIKQRGDVPSLVPQVLYEFWAVATRPVSANGLGLTPGEAATELARLKNFFQVFADSPDIYPEWEQLVTTHQVSGRKAHDARLVAAMIVHRITHILTFNTGDFVVYPGITVLDPAAVVGPPTP